MARMRPERPKAALPLILGSALALGCTPPAMPPSSRAAVSLVAPDGRHLSETELVSGADLSVVIFISRDCPCVAAHDERLRDLAGTFAPMGVKFVAVDSEVGATPEIETAEASKRHYPFAIVVDPGGAFAARLGAESATYTVILDRAGRVLYRGGIDSDRQRLHADATMYLRDALTDLTSGRSPRENGTAPLGCTLRKL